MRGSAYLKNPAGRHPAHHPRWHIFTHPANLTRMDHDAVADILKRAEDWPDADRAELAAYAQVIAARRDGIYRVSDDERAAIDKGLADVRAGDIVPDISRARR